MSSTPFDKMSSLYIPRVHNCSHVKDSNGKVYMNLAGFIIDIFHTLDIGKVSSVDIVPIPGSAGKKTNFSKAFVHFDKWYPESCELKEMIRESENDGSNTPFRLMYAAPHYWILKTNTSRGGDIKKIDKLEKRVVELADYVVKCNELLAEATQKLSNMKCVDDDDEMNNNESSSYKRQRNY
jgi:hypothetical protein